MDKFYKKRDDARKQRDTLIHEVKALRFNKNSTIIDDEFLQELSQLPMKRVKKIIDAHLANWVFTFLGTDTFSFTPEELGSKSNIPVERITKILNFFCLGFCEIEMDFFMPASFHKLMTHPFIKNENKYLYPVPGSILWAIQNRLEEFMNPNSKNSQNNDNSVWEQYLKTRAYYVESESLRLLSSALKCKKFYQGLIYEIEESGEKKQTELDGLIEFDTTLFLIEAKSGELTESARRGSKDRIKRDIRQLIGNAHNQALRAKKYIESTETPTFISKKGEIIKINKHYYRRTILVAVSLESLDVYNTLLQDSVKAGLLINDNELPWAVSLDSLRVISEMIEFPSQLLHYLLRRLRINSNENIETHDELDWFGNYLTEGLYFEKESKNNQFIQLLSFTTQFDDYYFYKMGIRKKPVKKPTQSLPEILRKIIYELDNKKDSKGHSEAIIQLLNWNESSRNEFVRLFNKIRKLSRKDNKVHDFSLISKEGSSGISCFSGCKQEVDEAFNKMCIYVEAKKYQQKCDEWLGLLTIIDEKELIHGMKSGIFPWVYDSDLEIAIATLFPQQPSELH